MWNAIVGQGVLGGLNFTDPETGMTLVNGQWVAPSLKSKDGRYFAQSASPDELRQFQAYAPYIDDALKNGDLIQDESGQWHAATDFGNKLSSVMKRSSDPIGKFLDNGGGFWGLAGAAGALIGAGGLAGYGVEAGVPAAAGEAAGAWGYPQSWNMLAGEVPEGGMTLGEVANGAMGPGTSQMYSDLYQAVQSGAMTPAAGMDAQTAIAAIKAAGSDPIQAIAALAEAGGGAGATAGAQALGFPSVEAALTSINPTLLSGGGLTLANLAQAASNPALLKTLLPALASAGGALVNRGAATDAAGIQAAAANNAAGVQKYMFDTTRADAMPWLQQGGLALGDIGRRLGISGDPNAPDYGSFMKNFTSADLATDPIYGASKDFQLEQTTKALTNAASARGETDSGVLLKDLLKYGSGILATTGNDAYNRFNANRTTGYNLIAPTANLGQASAVQLGQIGQTAGQVIGQNITGAGNAQAAGMVGGANAISGGINQALQQYQIQQLLDRFLPKTGAGVSPYGGAYGAMAE